MRAPGSHSGRQTEPLVISARLASQVRLEVHSHGAIYAFFDSNALPLGSFGAAAADRLGELRSGLPLGALGSGEPAAGKETDLLLRRLANHGLLEFALRREDGGAELAVIEPQVSGYWPRTAKLGDADRVVLSRFAYLRRRGDRIILESPLSDAVFKICDPKLISLVAMLAAPQQIKDLRQQDTFPGVELLALLLDSQFLFKTDCTSVENLRLAEGDPGLALWDFHDLLFHTRSTEGRHTNPVGGVYPHGGAIAELPALRPSWPGKMIDLCGFLDQTAEAMPPGAKLLRDRHSTRSFDDARPITLAELSEFLNRAARALPRPDSHAHSGGGPKVSRPYPTGGASYELEIYLAVNKCQGLAQGFYHYDAGAHALAPIGAPAAEVKAALSAGASAMGVATAPQILITIAARFGRVSWKYSSVAYSLILKDTGILTQTLYLMAEEMGLGGCAIGLANIDRFAKMTGIGYHIEGPVGQFALGRKAESPYPHQ